MVATDQRPERTRRWYRRRSDDACRRAGWSGHYSLSCHWLAEAIGDLVARRTHASSIIGTLWTVPRLLPSCPSCLLPRLGPLHLPSLQRLRSSFFFHCRAAGRRARLLGRSWRSRVPTILDPSTSTRATTSGFFFYYHFSLPTRPTNSSLLHSGTSATHFGYWTNIFL